MPAASPPSAQPSQVVGTRPGTDDAMSPIAPGPPILSSAAIGSPIRTKHKPPDPLPPERHSETCQAVTLTLATCVLLAGVALFFVAALCGAGAPRRSPTGCAAGLPLNPRAWVGLAAAVLFVGTVLLAALVWYLAWVKKEHNKARRAHEAAWRAFRVRAMPNAADRKIAALNLPLPVTSPVSTEPHDGVYYNNATTALSAGAGSPPPPPPDVWRIPPPPSPMSRAEVAHALAAMDAERSLIPPTQRLPSASADVATLSPLPVSGVLSAATNFHSLVPGALASPPPPVSTSGTVAIDAPGSTNAKKDRSTRQPKAAPDLPQHPVRPLFAGYGAAAQPAAPPAARTTAGSRHVALSHGAAAAPPATPPQPPRAVAGAPASPPTTRPPPKFVMMPGRGVRQAQRCTVAKEPRDDDAGRASDEEEEKANVGATTQHDARRMSDGDYSDPETMPPSPTVRALMAAAPPAPPRPSAQQQRPPPPPPRPNV